MDTDLKKYCFKLKNGSACLLKANDEQFDYLVTSKHLFESDESKTDTDKILNNEKIKIYYIDDDLTDKSFKLDISFDNNVFFHDSVDLCIIKIPKVKHLNDIYIEEEVLNVRNFLPLQVIGYPGVNNANEGVLKQSDSISVSRIEDANKEFLKIEFTNSTLNYKNINGISGGGLFSFFNGRITLLGIQSEVQNATLAAGKVYVIPIVRIQDVILKYNLRELLIKKLVNAKKIFNLQYYLENDSFYIQRDCDSVFKEYDNKNLWIFGNSGCGKTAYLLRNLKEREYHYFDLSMVSIRSVSDLYNEIINKFEIIFDVEIIRNPTNMVKSLLDCFSKVKQEVILVFDEFSLGDNYEEVLDWLNKLVVYQNKNQQKAVKRFIISTIQNPKEVIVEQRSIEYLNYIDLNNWDDNFLELYDVYSKHLVISKEDKERILVASNNNPRFLINLFKEMTCHNRSIDKILKG